MFYCLNVIEHSI